MLKNKIKNEFLSKIDIYNQFENHILDCYENYYPHENQRGIVENYDLMKKTLSNSSDIIFFV